MDFDSLANAIESKDGLYYALEDFFRYMISHVPTNDNLMLMTHANYCNISYLDIQTAFEAVTMKSSTTAFRDFSPHVTAGATSLVAAQGCIPDSTAPKLKLFSHVNLTQNN